MYYVHYTLRKNYTAIRHQLSERLASLVIIGLNWGPPETLQASQRCHVLRGLMGALFMPRGVSLLDLQCKFLQ